jgi:hypothetical protein
MVGGRSIYMSNYEAHLKDFIKITVQDGTSTYEFTLPTMETRLSSILEAVMLALRAAGFTYVKELVARNPEGGDTSSEDAAYE